MDCMKRTLNYISFLLLGSSLAFFAATSGCAARVGMLHDSDHRDYHRWDAEAKIVAPMHAY